MATKKKAKTTTPNATKSRKAPKASKAPAAVPATTPAIGLTPAATPEPTVPAKRTRKRAAAPKAKNDGLSMLDAAAKVLADAEGPMTCKALIEAMAAQGLWSSPKGKTPAATLSAALHREIKVKAKDSRFRKADRGQFGLAPSA